MKERPILFSAPMVRAILEGRKTQTRRVVKYGVSGPNPPNTLDFHDGSVWVGALHANGKEGNALALCRHGQSGDRLWVRETFAWCAKCGALNYRAAQDRCAGCDWFVERWKSSIHMPRRASRITLEVTGVRVERLQEISETDAKAEGVRFGYGEPFDPTNTISDRRRYELLWDQINAKRAPWASNPWVWVIEFKRLP